jgi:hypothetical protein
MEGRKMNQQEFESEIGKAKTFQQLEPKKQDFWAGYQRGLRRGYHGEKFGSQEEHDKWWSLVDDDIDSRVEQGQGYRAGFRCATLGREYCSQNDFCCETCSLVNYGRDCQNNPIQ